jgi:hypothetical protein
MRPSVHHHAYVARNRRGPVSALQFGPDPIVLLEVFARRDAASSGDDLNFGWALREVERATQPVTFGQLQQLVKHLQRIIVGRMGGNLYLDPAVRCLVEAVDQLSGAIEQRLSPCAVFLVHAFAKAVRVRIETTFAEEHAEARVRHGPGVGVDRVVSRRDVVPDLIASKHPKTRERRALVVGHLVGHGDLDGVGATRDAWHIFKDTAERGEDRVGVSVDELR